MFHLINKKGLGLEIGPSHNPLAPKKMGYNVDVVDHASAEQLREKYKGHGINLENIEDVDFVWQGQPLAELIGKRQCYDWIIASHVIEHVPDLVGFFQQCEILLKPQGVFSVVIPDKRFCFDFFQPLTLTGSLLDAYAARRTRPSAGQVFDHFANASKRGESIAWADNQGGADALVHHVRDARENWLRAEKTTDYIDVHCWRFTPESFELIIADLQMLGLVNLDIQSKFPTNGCEFYVSLGKVDSSALGDEIYINRLEKLNRLRW